MGSGLLSLEHNIFRQLPGYVPLCLPHSMRVGDDHATRSIQVVFETRMYFLPIMMPVIS